LGAGISENGMVKGAPQQPKTIEELEAQREAALHPPSVAVRGPASVAAESEESASGYNLFGVLHDFSIALNANDKAGVQDVLESLDGALNQVVLTRAQVGSRAMALDNYMQSVEKQKLDNKTAISQLEDADVYSTVSDISKTQSTLQATLETSGKMIQPSLMQFLR
jgi:flagellar hook-associated protein 3 FlgL